MLKSSCIDTLIEMLMHSEGCKHALYYMLWLHCMQL